MVVLVLRSGYAGIPMHSFDSAASPGQSLPYRWILPIAQLVVCAIALWPVRGYLAMNLVAVGGINRTSRPEPQTVVILPPDGPAPRLDSPADPSVQDAAKRLDLFTMHLQVPVVMNVPVLLVQLPYVIMSQGKRDWAPRGMMHDAWRAMALPFVGLIFWWSAGRGFEAFFMCFRNAIQPKISWVEAILAALMSLFGAAVVIGVLLSPPNDRKDLLTFGAGFALWSALSLPLVLAKVLQWRMKERVNTLTRQAAV